MLALVLALGGTSYAASQSSGGVKLVYVEAKGSIKPGSEGEVLAGCPTGTRPSGGGFDMYTATGVTVVSSAATNTVSNHFAGSGNQAADAWAVNFRDNGTTTETVYAYAVCAPE
jgi:hypothetical protein